MACLVVESLFTNIPSEEAIQNCVNDLFFDKSEIGNLTKQDLYDLSSAAAKELIFIFRNSLSLSSNIWSSHGVCFRPKPSKFFFLTMKRNG